MSFSELGLSPKVLAAVEASGYATPTLIESQAIPHVLAGRDVVGIAQTGTGKTASFVLPMLTRLEQGRARARMPRTLILEPTRELAAQVEENFKKYGQNHKLNVCLIIGGVSFGDQEKKLDRGADVLIATPGRLLDHFERGKLLLGAVEIFIIDEADRMLDMGFIPDIERISKLLPPKRQTLLFSATMPPEIQRLADAFLTDPVRVEVAKPATTAKTVAQHFVAAGREPAAKRDLLRRLIRGQDLKNAIIFCNRKRDVATLARSLQRHGFSAGALHGDMDQRSRTNMLDSFRKDQLTLLVASDVAARGLDIPDVSHIFNFDVPSHAEDYVHRIGRTGRAGKSGTAITLATSLDRKYVTAIEELTGDPVAWMDFGPVEDEPAPRHGGDTRRGEGRRGEDRRRERRPARAGAEHAHASDRDRARPSEGERRTEHRAAAPSAPRAAEPDAPSLVTPTPRRGEDRPRRGGERERPEPRVVGLGDHVPQFLLRPVRLP